MAKICLPPDAKQKLLKLVSEDGFHIKMKNLTNEKRVAIFEDAVGDDFARLVNSRYEQVIASKRKASLDAWNKAVKESKEFPEHIRRDISKRIARNEKLLVNPGDETWQFLDDLVATRMGMRLTEDEAKTLVTLKKTVDEIKAKIPEDYLEGEIVSYSKRPKEVIEYGLTNANYLKYIENLRQGVENDSPQTIGKTIWDYAGITKTLKGSMDLGFAGRQALPVLMRGNVKEFASVVTNTFKNLLREIKAGGNELNAIDLARAEIFSRPNALNGKYNAAKDRYGLSIAAEEALPSKAPEQWSGPLGKAFRVSGATYNATALQLRADLADAFIAIAEKSGVDVMNPVEARGISRRVGNLSGRGQLTTFDKQGDVANQFFFAPRFMRSRFNLATGGQFYKDATKYERKQAALDTVRVAMGVSATMGIAAALGADVETDPRSPRFGMICMGGQCYDVTGGVKGFATLGSRLVPTMHNGEWGFWTKSGSTLKHTKLSDGGFGDPTAFDYFIDFMAGKLAPTPAIIRDMLKGETYDGGSPYNPLTIAANLTLPITPANAWKRFESGEDGGFLANIGDLFGTSPSPQVLFPGGNRWEALKEKKGERVHQDVLEQVTDRYYDRVERLKSSTRWDRMTNEEQSKELDKIKKEEMDKALRKYGI